MASLDSKIKALSKGSEAFSVVKSNYTSQAQCHGAATTAHCMYCSGSLLLPLHLAIIRSDFLMMFPPVATWMRAVGFHRYRSLIS